MICKLIQALSGGKSRHALPHAIPQPEIYTSMYSRHGQCYNPALLMSCLRTCSNSWLSHTTSSEMRLWQLTTSANEWVELTVIVDSASADSFQRRTPVNALSTLIYPALSWCHFTIRQYYSWPETLLCGESVRAVFSMHWQQLITAAGWRMLTAQS